MMIKGVVRVVYRVKMVKGNMGAFKFFFLFFYHTSILLYVTQLIEGSLSLSFSLSQKSSIILDLTKALVLCVWFGGQISPSTLYFTFFFRSCQWGSEPLSAVNEDSVILMLRSSRQPSPVA